MYTSNRKLFYKTFSKKEKMEFERTLTTVGYLHAWEIKNPAPFVPDVKALLETYKLEQVYIEITRGANETG